MNEFLSRIVVCVVILSLSSSFIGCKVQDVIEEIDEAIEGYPENKKKLEELKKWLEKDGQKETVVQDRVHDMIKMLKLDEDENKMCSRKGYDAISTCNDQQKAYPFWLKRTVTDYVKKYNAACLARTKEEYEYALDDIRPEWIEKIKIFVDIVNLREGLMVKSRDYELSSSYTIHSMESKLMRKFKYEKVGLACEIYESVMKEAFAPGYPLQIGTGWKIKGELAQAKMYFEACRSFLKGPITLQS